MRTGITPSLFINMYGVRSQLCNSKFMPALGVHSTRMPAVYEPSTPREDPMHTIIRTFFYRILLITGVGLLFSMASIDRALPADDTLWQACRDSGLQAWQEGRLGAAERLLITAMEQAEKFGPEDLRVADTANDLAVVYATAGKTTEAERFFHRALMIGEKGLGGDHPAVGATIQNLGILYAMQQKFTEAEPLLKRALEINVQRFGVTHARTALSLKILSSFYALQGQLLEAERFIQKSLDILEAVQVKQGDPQMAATLKIFATILRNTNREQEAQEIEQRLQADATVIQ
jgi:tetratricopeptide (TPR) repeat protein